MPEAMQPTIRAIVQMPKGGQEFSQLFGIYPGDRLADDVGRAVGAHGAPRGA